MIDYNNEYNIDTYTIRERYENFSYFNTGRDVIDYIDYVYGRSGVFDEIGIYKLSVEEREIEYIKLCIDEFAEENKTNTIAYSNIMKKISKSMGKKYGFRIKRIVSSLGYNYVNDVKEYEQELLVAELPLDYFETKQLNGYDDSWINVEITEVQEIYSTKFDKVLSEFRILIDYLPRKYNVLGSIETEAYFGDFYSKLDYYNAKLGEMPDEIEIDEINKVKSIEKEISCESYELEEDEKLSFVLSFVDVSSKYKISYRFVFDDNFMCTEKEITAEKMP